jgi:hypothetical protein
MMTTDDDGNHRHQYNDRRLTTATITVIVCHRLPLLSSVIAVIGPPLSFCGQLLWLDVRWLFVVSCALPFVLHLFFVWLLVVVIRCPLSIGVSSCITCRRPWWSFRPMV